MEVNDYITQKLTHSIHTSERLSYRGCRRRWNWVFNDRYYPLTTPKPLEFGTAFHKAMEKWYEPEFWDKDPETRLTLAETVFRNTCNEQKAAYYKSQQVSELDAETEVDYLERVTLGIGMIRYHALHVSPKLDIGLTPIKTEIEFEVPITDDQGNQMWCKCAQCWKLFRASEFFEVTWKIWQSAKYLQLGDIQHPLSPGGLFHAMPPSEREKHYRNEWRGLPVTYGGRIDCLMQDGFGRLWIVDWKTAARLSGQEEGDAPDEFIQLDDQITSYCWALWLLGIEVAGFIHHEIKKAFPVEPEPNKQKRKGAWYSVNKMQNTSYDLYLETIKEGDPTGYDSGAYDEFLDFLKASGNRYYSRKQVFRSAEELRQAGRNIWLEATEMCRTDLPIYPSPGRFACSFCAFRQPCIATNRGEDVSYLLESSYEKRDRRYWEKVAPSTDSRGGQ